MSHAEDNEYFGAVAIVGMAGRFPGASSVDDLWRILTEGKETISFFSDDELDFSIDPALKKHPNYIKARGIIEGAENFDAAFFGMTPREAEIMDPQQRIFLEVAWHALENAGYNPETYEKLIGIFAGTGLNTYFINHVLPRQDAIEKLGFHQTQLANAPDYLAARVSYKLNLRGPSVSLYTGCSTSLVAVCYAFDSLMSYQCDLALAGGVFIQCPVNSGYLYQEGEMYSIDGHTRPFDAAAHGTVFSDGAGVVVLKRLQDALEDGDFIYAVIRGTAVNNDGSDKMSFTAPSVSGQAEVIAMAHANAEVDPETISYVETHGTATPLGDPIEIEALRQAFRAHTSKKNFCAIGSIKSNIGHLDAAAGIAGLIKTSLALHHKLIPPSLHFEQPNPQIDFVNSPFYVNTKLSYWNIASGKRRAGVSSFGVGGTNAHVVLEESPQVPPSGRSRPRHLLLLSARTTPALEKMTENLTEHLKQNQHLNLADVAYTLQVGRKHFNNRRMAVCSDLTDAVACLETCDSKRVITATLTPATRDLVFMFSGQGSQYVNMGAELYRNEFNFRREVDRCSEVLSSQLAMDLREIIYPEQSKREEASRVLMQTYAAQPALFVIEYALARLWMSWGVIPSALLGHSIGEYVAACLAGVFSLEEALFLVAERGRLIQSLPSGSMLAVYLPEEELQPYLNDDLSVAVINGPSLCVVSGGSDAVAALEKRLADRKLDFRRLHTSHAFHSKMVEPILEAFRERLQNVKMNPPSVPFLSNCTGTWADEEVATPSYWLKHLRQTVRFADCLAALLKEPHRIFLEIGPGNTLCGLVMQHPNRSEDQIALPSLRHPSEEVSDEAFLLRTLGNLWLAGIPIDWASFHAGESRKRVPLPGYPFESKRYWLEAKRRQENLVENLSEHCADRETTSGAEQADKASSAIISFDLPVNEIERDLADIWQKLLGYNCIHLDDNFFELGGNSLTAVRLFSQIERIYGIRLPLATLYRAPTVKQLARVVGRKELRPGWSPLVEIQGGNLKPPFFCVHAEGGNVLEYRHLAKHLGSGQPFYGLQAMGLEGTEVIAPSIEEMAAQYLEEIRTVQEKGPYYLGGYCLGGLVAYEMAQQLLAKGEHVAFLTLISCSTPDHIRDVPQDQTWLHKLGYRILERIELEWDNLSPLDYRSKIQYIKERLLRVSALVSLRIEGTVDHLLEKLRVENRWRSRAFILQRSVELSDKAYMAYKPKPIDKPLVLFRVSELTRMRNPDPTLGWRDLAKGGLIDYEVYGYHKNILREPNVRALAEILKRCLEEAYKNFENYVRSP